MNLLSANLEAVFSLSARVIRHVAMTMVAFGNNQFDLPNGDGLHTADMESLAIRLEAAAGVKADRPTVVCLCGSTRFWREFQRASLSETMAGRIVLSIGAASGTDDEHFGNLPREEYERVKTMLDELHLRKIDMADEVLILNVGGYIGDSTRQELAYARKLGKVLRFLEPGSEY